MRQVGLGLLFTLACLGCGSRALRSAEAAAERGDFEQATNNYRALYRADGADSLTDAQRVRAEEAVTKWAEQRVSAVKDSPDDEAVAALTSDAKHIASGFPGVVSRILVPAIVARGIGAKEVPMLEQLARELGSSSHEAAKSLRSAVVAAAAKWSFSSDALLELRTLVALSSEYEKQTELKSLLTQKLDAYVPREGPLDVRVRRAEEAVSLVSNDATKTRLAEARRAIAEHLSARRTSELSEILDAFLGRLVQRWADGPSVSPPVSAPSISTSTRWRVTTNCGGSEFIPKSSTGGDISVLVTGRLTCGKYEKQVGTTLEDQYRRTERVCRTVQSTQTVGKTYNTDTNQWTGGHQATVSEQRCTGGDLEVQKVEKPVYETYDTLQGAFEIRASGQSTSSKFDYERPHGGDVGDTAQTWPNELTNDIDFVVAKAKRALIEQQVRRLRAGLGSAPSLEELAALGPYDALSESELRRFAEFAGVTDLEAVAWALGGAGAKASEALEPVSLFPRTSSGDAAPGRLGYLDRRDGEVFAMAGGYLNMTPAQHDGALHGFVLNLRSTFGMKPTGFNAKALLEGNLARATRNSVPWEVRAGGLAGYALGPLNFLVSGGIGASSFGAVFEPSPGSLAVAGWPYVGGMIILAPHGGVNIGLEAVHAFRFNSSYGTSTVLLPDVEDRVELRVGPGAGKSNIMSWYLGARASALGDGVFRGGLGDSSWIVTALFGFRVFN